jgi:alpha-beta hydrolase superfamily lysophospholipase
MTEQGVLFSAQSLVGVLTKADEDADASRPIVVFLNAGMVHRVGPNRLHVRLARELAQRGFASLRFDLSGIGDSPARVDGTSLHDAGLRDVRDALDFVANEHEGSTFLLVGLCSGADLAFRAALADERVVGGVLIDGFPYHTFRSRLHRRARRYASQFRGRAWRELLGTNGPIVRRLRRSPKAVLPPGAHRQRDVPSKDEADAGLHALMERGVRLLVLNTPDRDYSYPRHFVETFPTVRSDRIKVAFFSDADHTFTLRANQDLLIRTITEWISCFQ